MIIGQKYFVSFYAVNSGKYNFSIANNKLGLNLYTVAFDSCCPPPLLNTAKLYTDSILTDTLNWTKISGSFIADSAYQYLCISNFFDDASTDTIELYPFYSNGYYYIDDVCLSTDSIYNETWTGLNNLEGTSPTISIFPNPTSGFFTIESPIPIFRYSLINMNGQLLAEHSSNFNLKFQIDLTEYPNGIYILRIQTKFNVSNLKIILAN
ncbi:MAG: T9SS type A sorting domain-containing protein [Bacteroidetes bacterium]|nr:T9SS type A sorting domain-containing protein [Bacteroidota bacterium]